MMQKVLLTFLSGMSWIAAAPAFASMQTTYTFTRVSPANAAIDIAAQLSFTVHDDASALANYGLVLGSGTNSVLFTFHNAVGEDSSISEIYFDDGTIQQQTAVHNDLGGSTDFAGGGANPGNLPGGANVAPPFVATAQFSADAQGNPSEGVDTATDIVGIEMDLLGTLTYADVIAALGSGDLRVGIHVRSIDTQLDNGKSDSFVNGPPDEAEPVVPEPTSLLVWTGLISSIGLIVYRRRRS
jgi:hypothetical protein